MSAGTRAAIAAGISAVVVLIGVLYFIFDPADSALAPKCIFHSLTGWDCPGCGSQRMLHALLHGDLRGAWHANAFLLCASPLLALMIFSALFRTRLPRLYNILNSVPSIIIVSASLTAWTILRNL